MADSTLCSVTGCCNDPSKGKRGMCNAHYLRWKRHGDPLAGRRSPGSNACGKGFCPAAKKLFAHWEYCTKKDLFKARAAKWREDNAERYRARLEAYFGRDDVKERARETTRRWAAENPERKREMDRRFAQENPALVTSYKAKRRAKERQATPPWLTESHESEMRAIYAEARKLTDSTGERHEVDHIVPLQGKTVCGLHVPWNLRVLTRDENNRRPRVWSV